MWQVGMLVLMVGGLTPALFLGARGQPGSRLIGLQMAGAISVLVLLMFAHAAGQSSYLIVPLTLVLLSTAGILVFTRLLSRTR